MVPSSCMLLVASALVTNRLMNGARRKSSGSEGMGG